MVRNLFAVYAHNSHTTYPKSVIFLPYSPGIGRWQNFHYAVSIKPCLGSPKTHRQRGNKSCQKTRTQNQIIVISFVTFNVKCQDLYAFIRTELTQYGARLTAR